MYFIESARFLKWFVNFTRMFVNMKIMYFILAKFVHVNVIHLNKFSVKLWKKFTDFFLIYIFQIQTYKISIKLMSICKRLTLNDNLVTENKHSNCLCKLFHIIGSIVNLNWNNNILLNINSLQIHVYWY